MTNGVLRMLAGQLGNEWRELAAALSVPRMRIQAILRQHVNLDTADTRYDMLVTWAKRVPRSIDKVTRHLHSYVQILVLENKIIKQKL